jgi:7-cyano-7-deazaguanine synthase
MGPMSETAHEHALVLFSGGQDSSVCLAWALESYARVETVGFDYGQRHGVEMAARQVVRQAIRDRFPAWAPLPSTFVPGRNLVFLAYAAALADRRGAGVLVGGMCETDFSGYPDCRRVAIEAQGAALNLGMDQDFRIETPLMALTKAQTWALARRLGGEALVEVIVEDSHTCYRGERGVRHAWGYGCGDCPACDLRARGWAAWVGQGRPALAP